MKKSSTKASRREQILQALAHMLEISPGARITTAALARQVGVSEAALYRHFPSKSKMFEGLLSFVEEAIFTRVTLISNDKLPALDKCNNILMLLLSFTERNPGITRLLTGDALIGENERLRVRVVQLFNRLETQIKQIIREAEISENLRPSIPVSSAANLLLVAAEGHVAQFVRSEFKLRPTQSWQEQWPVLTSSLMTETPDLRASSGQPA